MDPIGAISLVSLLLILALCAGMLVRRFVYGKESAEQKKIAEEKKQQPFTAEGIRKAAKAYSERASNGHHFRDLETGFIAGAEWRGKRVAAYIRECLEPEEEWAAKHEADDTEANKNYTRGKIRGYKDILGDLEIGGLDEYMSEKEKEK